VNVLKPHLQTTILTLLAVGKSQREIARITRVDRKTIRSLALGATAGDSNSPGVAIGPVAQIPPPRRPAPPTVSPSACEPYRAFITEQLRRRRNYTAVYKDLVDRFGFAAGYNSVERFAGTSLPRSQSSSTALSSPRRGGAGRLWRGCHDARARHRPLPAPATVRDDPALPEFDPANGGEFEMTNGATNICGESTERHPLMNDYCVALIDDASATCNKEQQRRTQRTATWNFALMESAH
jgi:hypothetical protein